jgi:hypothetical protein
MTVLVDEDYAVDVDADEAITITDRKQGITLRFSNLEQARSVANIIIGMTEVMLEEEKWR